LNGVAAHTIDHREADCAEKSAALPNELAEGSYMSLYYTPTNVPKDSTSVRIHPVAKGRNRPVWSVMIPVYNRTKYLAQALNSVLAQGFDQQEMQVEVVDDCSAEGDSEDVVKAINPKRISFYRQSRRVGMAANWNTCIERARGRLVHILHDDDFVGAGY